MSDLSRVSPEGTKTCARCSAHKSIDQFYKRKARGKTQPDSYCKQCRIELAKAGHCPKRARELSLQRSYGITGDDYTRMFREQRGVCAVCFLPNPRRPLAVDHNHKTGEVRGLLCDPCNRAIGMLKDSPTVLRSAAQYLEERGSYADD